MSKPQVKEKSETHFYGTYKGHEIQIDWDDDNDGWYILVWNEQGYGYDGWWKDDNLLTTIDDAIEEAIDVAQLEGSTPTNNSV